MPEISRITLPSGTTYDIKDAVARSIVAGGGVTFRGVTGTPLSDESPLTTYEIGGSLTTAVNGDLVIYEKKEFVYSTDDHKWHELGDNSSFGEFAYVNSASGEFTPSGTVSAPQFTGINKQVEVAGNSAGSVTVNINQSPSQGNYTPSGSITKPGVTVTLQSTYGYVTDSATGGGSVTPGSAASCIMPSMNMTVQNETLSFEWSEGTFSPNTPTQVVLPSFTSQQIATGVQTAELAATPAFTGDTVAIGATFTPDIITLHGTYTPEGTVAAPDFTGTEGTVTVGAI